MNNVLYYINMKIFWREMIGEVINYKICILIKVSEFIRLSNLYDFVLNFNLFDCDW